LTVVDPIQRSYNGVGNRVVCDFRIQMFRTIPTIAGGWF